MPNKKLLGLKLGDLKLLILVSSFIFYAFFAFAWLSKINISGDEPHYLLVAQSIVKDHDLELENDQLQGSFLFSGKLDPHFSSNSQNGHKYPSHGVGFPLALALGYLLAKNYGAILILTIISTLFAYNIFLLSYDLSRGKDVAVLFWLAISFSLPIIVYSSSLYGEILTALIIAYSLRKIITLKYWLETKWGFLHLILLNLGLSFLPLIHGKYFLTTIIFLAFFAYSLYQVKARPSQYAYFLISLTQTIFIAISWFYYYGSISPLAQLGQSQNYNLRQFLEGFLGQFFDKGKGLFFLNPLYFLFLAGLVVLWLKDKKLVLWLIAILASIFIPNSINYYWAGGWSPLLRFLVPLVPFLALFLLYAFIYLDKKFRYVFIILTDIGLVFGLMIKFNPEMAFTLNENSIFDKMHPFLHLNLSQAAPSIMYSPNLGGAKTICWLLLFLLLNLLLLYPRITKIKK